MRPFTLAVSAAALNLDPWCRAFDVRPGQALYLPPGGRVRIW